MSLKFHGNHGWTQQTFQDPRGSLSKEKVIQSAALTSVNYISLKKQRRQAWTKKTPRAEHQSNDESMWEIFLGRCVICIAIFGIIQFPHSTEGLHQQWLTKCLCIHGSHGHNNLFQLHLCSSFHTSCTISSHM